MDLKLRDKVAVVTGSSKGIGAGIAKAFAKAGAKVVVNYVSSKHDAEKVVNQIKQDGGTAIAIHCDISKSADVKRLFEETKNAFGRVDILVNSAGILKFEPLEEVTEESFHQQVNINLLGNLLCTQQAVEMFGDRGGSIINISATSSTNPIPSTVVFSAAKAGVDNMTKVLAKELGARKIRINTIAPGPTATEGNEHIRDSEMWKKMLTITPLGREGHPGDIAKVAIFLASDDAGWVTGERITVAGGLL